MDKRTFLKKSKLLGVSSIVSMDAIGKMIESVSHLSPEQIASDDDFWTNIRGGYKLKSEYINLENGYYCIMPQETLEKQIQHIRDVNLHGSFYMRTVQYENKKKIAAQLSEIAGCTPEELIITRNTTESLDMIISGLDWQPGDEAVMAVQDYGAMLDMFRQVSKRYGIVNKMISVPLHPHSDEEIVELYEKAITEKTKLLMVCHMINITGQILPVKKICDMARKKNVQVMVDGAHAFAHIQFKISELGCDYYGCSLHKWLSTPLGAGLLYVKKERIPGVWPLFAESERKADDISRLNHTGTIPVHVDLTIPDAIEFYKKIGAERKEARLRYLQRYWTDQVRNVPDIILNTPKEPERSCAIANVGVKGKTPAELQKILYEQYKIYTVAIDGAEVHGCRITPNVYTTTAELDVLVKALNKISE
ncbi:MAG: aminotransferase class V-fold PLP-dependent enzyme [Bacteroidia bacterium]